MEYQKKYKVIAPPRRFHWTDEHIKLERKIQERHTQTVDPTCSVVQVELRRTRERVLHQGRSMG